MDAPATTSCTACGRTQEQVRKLIAVEGPTLCDDCIKRYQFALANALEEESRARAGASVLIEAEEMALNLIDALETSRAEQAERELEEANLKTYRGLRLVDLEGGAVGGERPESEYADSEPPPEAPPLPETRPEAAPKAAVEEPSVEAEEAPEAAELAVAFISVGNVESALADVDGKPRVARAWAHAVESGAFPEVIVLSDDARVIEAVTTWGGKAQQTDVTASSDAKRAAELARARPEIGWLVCLPVDAAPSADALRALAAAREDPDIQIATLARPLEEDERRNPEVVKVVMGRSQDALYFSRGDIPFERMEGAGFPHRYAHIPFFAYRRDALLELAKLPASPLEETERVSALRAIECGMKIRCLITLG